MRSLPMTTLPPGPIEWLMAHNHLQCYQHITYRFVWCVALVAKQSIELHSTRGDIPSQGVIVSHGVAFPV